MSNGATGGSQGSGAGQGMSDRLSSAVDELRKAAEDASGDVRSRLDSAVEQIREASGTATARAQEAAGSASTRAQEAAGELRGQLEGVRSWIQSATSDLLDEAQKEIDRRRQQLTGGGDPGPSGGSGSTS